MSLMVTNGSEMIRYNPSTSSIEYSNSKGYSWFMRYRCSGMGNVRAMTMHKGEVILCSDYLDGMLGHQAVGNAMLQASEKWFDDNVKMPKDVAEQNAFLYNIYRELSLSVPAGSSPDDAKFRSDCVNALKNVIDLNSEQLFLETAYNEYVIPVIKNVLPRIV